MGLDVNILLLQSRRHPSILAGMTQRSAAIGDLYTAHFFDNAESDGLDPNR